MVVLDWYDTISIVKVGFSPFESRGFTTMVVTFITGSLPKGNVADVVYTLWTMSCLGFFFIINLEAKMNRCILMKLKLLTT